MEQFDVVMLRKDIKAEGLKRWQIGTILEVWDENHYEVEISDINGFTLFLGALSKDNLELIWENNSSSYVGRFKDILQILLELRKLVESSKLGLYTSSFKNVEEVLHEIDLLVNGFKRETIDTIEKLKLYFAPTGLFQEIALDNGWISKYTDFSLRFESFISI